jgi:TrpR-related protein YerC/YecD
MLKKITPEMIQDVYNLLASVDNPKDMELLFQDLCTNKEVEQMAQRIAAARLLIEGNTYNKVIEKTDISSATLSRVSRCVQYGNGYKKFIK